MSIESYPLSYVPTYAAGPTIYSSVTRQFGPVPDSWYIFAGGVPEQCQGYIKAT